MKKKALIAASSVVLLSVGLGLAGHRWLLGRFEKSSVVAQMEEAWNCRAELDSTQVQLFSNPARVELRGLKLAPRDDQMALPPGARKPLEGSQVLLSTDSAVLEVELRDLLSGRVNVRALHINGVAMRSEVDEEGRSNVQMLFKSPDSADATSPGAPVKETVSAQAGDTKATGVTVTQIKDPAVPAPAGPSAAPKAAFRASDMKVAVQVEEASLNGGSVAITNRKNATQIEFTDLRVLLKGIDVNASNLAAHNHCGFELESGIRVENTATKLQVANFTAVCEGSLSPFDVATGDWNPDLDLGVLLKKGGLLGGIPLADQLGKKDREKLEKFGLDVTGIDLGGVLQEDATLKVHQIGGKIIVKGDTRLVLPQYEIIVLDKSWVYASQDLHIVRGRIVLNADLTAKNLEGLRKALSEEYGEALAGLGFGIVSATLLDPQGRLSLPFRSKGSLSKPDFGFDNMLNDVKGMIKGSGGDLLKGLLGQ